MRRIDVLYTQAPYLGYRKMTAILRREGHAINSKRVRRLMQVMGLEALYCKPNTSKPHPQHHVYPYLLKGLAITIPNQVWATDITYIRLHSGWVYLVAIIDWYSCYVLSWRMSESMDVSFCLEALEDALSQATPDIIKQPRRKQRGMCMISFKRHVGFSSSHTLLVISPQGAGNRSPARFNSDQGSQFTSEAFTARLRAAEIAISMDGRGSYHDNIFTERLWRSIKYEEVYLKEYTSLAEAEEGIGAYIDSYRAPLLTV